MREEVLVFLKPDAVIRRGIGAKVIQEFIDNKFEISYFGEIRPTREFIAEHYAQHKEKFFYNWLIEYITSSPLLLLIMRGEEIVYKIRVLLGPTLPEKNSSNTIRGRYGILGGINVAHASDSVDNGRQEVDRWKKIVKIQDRDHMQKAIEYIKKYIDFPIVDTEEYRKISKLLVGEKIAKEDAKNIISELLQTESDFDNNTISQFADVVIENALLRKKEMTQNDNFC